MVKSIFMSCFTSLFYVPTLKKQEISMRWLSICWEALAEDLAKSNSENVC